jgi:hypothetical protein
MVKGKDDEAVMNVHYETGYDNLWMVKGVDRLRYIRDTKMEDKHR